MATLGQKNDDKQAPRINLSPKLVTEDRGIDIAGSVSKDSAIV